MKKLLISILLIFLYFNTQAQWIQQQQDSSFFEVNDAYFFDEHSGFVCGQVSHGIGFILKTTNGGIDWQRTDSAVMVCQTIQFVNDSVGYAAGQDGVVYWSTDRGENWSFLSVVAATQDIEDMFFINDSIGFVKNYDSRLFKTTDKGFSWTRVPNLICGAEFYDRKNNSLYFHNDSIGFLVGYGVFKTTDQWNTWSKQNSDSTKYYRSICMINDLEGFAVGNAGVLIHTTDGGANWTTRQISDQDLRDIRFISDSIGFIVGGGHNYSNDSIGIVLTTLDRGMTWRTDTISNVRLNSFTYIDSVAYVTGNYGNIFRNDNFQHLLTDFITPKPIAQSMSIWPNPASEKIFFNLSGEKVDEFEVYDINGRRLMFGNIVESSFINTSSLPEGMFLIKIRNGHKIFLEKFIITH